MRNAKAVWLACVWAACGSEQGSEAAGAESEAEGEDPGRGGSGGAGGAESEAEGERPPPIGPRDGEGESEAEAEAEAEGEGEPGDYDGEGGLAEGGGDEGEGEGESESESEGEPIDPGQLTAGDWDDNRNFEFFLEYLSEYRQAHGGAPAPARGDRIVIEVQDDAGAPVGGARVVVAGQDGEVLSAPTSPAGTVLLFPQEDGLVGPATVTVTPPGGAARSFAAPAGDRWTFSLAGARATPPEALDVAFVIDTTGSMGDEIEYLKAEIDDIAARVEAGAPGLSARWALIVYRDEGDAYVVRARDFTTLRAFREDLERQSAAGGGDYPEAADRALAAANELSWRDGPVARIAFFVADAPPHAADEQTFVDESDLARRRGVAIYPVAASGVGDAAEYLMRLAAQATQGRYVFLTDDSGIGGEHAEPHIPCYEVELLRDLIVRAIRSELAGRRLPGDPDEVIRTVGNPVGGICIDDEQSYYL